MIHLGITGSIASGKSTVCSLLARNGVFVVDMDKEVHDLYSNYNIVSLLADVVPEAITDKKTLDRRKLAALIAHNPNLLTRVEERIHPIIFERERAYKKRLRRQGVRIMVSEVPLMVEKHLACRYDLSVFVAVPYWLRRQRACRYRKIAPQHFSMIDSKQYSASVKRRHASLVINNGLNKAELAKQVQSLLYRLNASHPLLSAQEHKRQRPLPPWNISHEHTTSSASGLFRYRNDRFGS